MNQVAVQLNDQETPILADWIIDHDNPDYLGATFSYIGTCKIGGKEFPDRQITKRYLIGEFKIDANSLVS